MKVPALIICLFFIAWMLRSDIKRRRTLSWAVWIPTVYLLIVGSRPLSEWLGLGHPWNGNGLVNDSEGSPVDQVFFFSFLVGSLVLATARGVQWGKFFAANAPLMLFYLYFVASICWSEDPTGSFKRLFKDFGMLFIVAVILSEKDPFEAMRAVYVRCACVLFPLSAVFIKWYPEYARSFSPEGTPMYTGVTMQKNTLGEIVLCFSAFMIWDYLESLQGKFRWSRVPWDRVLLLVMGVWLLHMCQSKTSLVCLMMATALMLRKGWFSSKLVSRVVLFGALSLPYLVFFAQKFSDVIAPVVQALGRNMTFTGRTDIWNHIDLTTVNPLIGFGYYNFWGGSGGARVNEAMQMMIPNAHDGYVDLYLDGGLIGLAILFSMLIAYGNRFIKTLERDGFQKLRFAMLIAAIIYNLSESNWARISTIWFTTLLVLSYVPSIKPVWRRRAVEGVAFDHDRTPAAAEAAELEVPCPVETVARMKQFSRLSLSR